MYYRLEEVSKVRLVVCSLTAIKDTILSVFDMSMLICILWSIGVISNLKKTIQAIGLGIVASFILGYSDKIVHQQALVAVLSMVIVLLVVLIINSGSIIDGIITYLFCSILVAAVEMIIALVLSRFVPGFELNFKFGLLSQSIAVMLFFSAIYFSYLRKAFRLVMDGNKIVKLIIANAFLVLVAITIYWNMNPTAFIESAIGILFIVLITISINVIYLNTEFKEKVLSEKVSAYETYLPIIEDVIAEIRSKQHDYHNHIQTLKILVENSRIDNPKIQRYIHDLTGNAIWKSWLLLSNKVLAGLIFSKYKFASSVGIELQLVIYNHEIKSNYTDYELVEMFSILIDNAIEAAQRVNGDYVNVEIGVVEGKNYLKVSNPSLTLNASEIRNMFEKYKTDVTSKRGWGLIKLSKMLTSNQDRIDVYFESETNKIEFNVQYS
jgi:hypothetical protein